MKRALSLWWPVFVLAFLAAPLLAACGGGKGARPATDTPAEREWVLVRNPRFGGTMAEPEYIWVDRKDVPKTLTGYVFGEKHVIAPPDAYAKAVPPPGPGSIWRPPEGETESAAAPAAPGGHPSGSAAAGAAPGALPPASQRPEVGSGPAATAPRSDDRRGYVVLADGIRIVIDLTDGEVRKDALITITRREALTHPVTGEVLGEFTQEIGRARIVDVQPKFSVAELIGFKPGLTVKPRDRVTVLPGGS